MFSDLKWVSFPERVIHIKAIQMSKTIRGEAPEYLMSAFTFTSDIHTRLLRYDTVKYIIIIIKVSVAYSTLLFDIIRQ